MDLPPAKDVTNMTAENVGSPSQDTSHHVANSVPTSDVRTPFPPLGQRITANDTISHDGADSGIDVLHDTPNLRPSGETSQFQQPTSVSKSRKQKISRHLPDSPCFHPDPNHTGWGSPLAGWHSTTVDSRISERLLRLATASARQRVLNQRSNSIGDGMSKMPGKVITWQTATESRPPLRIDMSGPSPTTYSPRNKPLYETNAPAYSFGRKETEKDGSGQKAWGKLWFRSHTPFTHKTNFELRWPSVSHYEHKSTLGPKQAVRVQFPSHSIGIRHNVLSADSLKTNVPASNQYEPELAHKHIMYKAPAFTMGSRIPYNAWVNSFNVPAPNTYSPKSAMRNVKPSGPAFTMCVQRRFKRHDIGPFATL